MRQLRLPFLILAAAAAASPALAHPGHEADSLFAGLGHPITGVDHLLAMVAVGVLASLRGGGAQWAWPAGFLAAMLAGFGLGQVMPGGGVEPAILASVIVLGGLLAANTRLPAAVGLLLITGFGLAHGYAHGMEAPAGGAAFPAGFLLSTAALHAVGLLIGQGLRERPGFARLIGVATAAGGFALAVTA